MLRKNDSATMTRFDALTSLIMALFRPSLSSIINISRNTSISPIIAPMVRLPINLSFFSYRISFYLTSMLLRLLVVVDAHEENVASVFGYLRRIFLALDLVDGSVGGMIEL